MINGMKEAQVSVCMNQSLQLYFVGLMSALAVCGAECSPWVVLTHTSVVMAVNIPCL